MIKVSTLVGIDKAKSKCLIVPSDQLMIKARFLKKKSNIWMYECEAYVNQEFVASAEIRYATVFNIINN